MSGLDPILVNEHEAAIGELRAAFRAFLSPNASPRDVVRVAVAEYKRARGTYEQPAQPPPPVAGEGTARRVESPERDSGGGVVGRPGPLKCTCGGDCLA